MKNIHPSKALTKVRLGAFLLLLLLMASIGSKLFAEGSKDFLNYPGYRLFLWAEEPQQMKVYANAGEFLNIGSSHIAIAGGFVRVFRPDGTFHSIIDNQPPFQGLGIIENDVQERFGPTGGGSTNGQGYIPAVIPVMPGEAGVWTVTFEYPTYTGTSFSNLLNNQPWTRAVDQPTNRRVVLAWDITVTQGSAGNNNGTPVEGRVYSNDYNSIVNRNGNTTSPVFYILTKEGYQFEVKFNETDPWGFPIFSNSTGIVDGNFNALYQSLVNGTYERSSDPALWEAGKNYLYEPQARDNRFILNNKVFFNFPDPFMPTSALVTDIYRNDTHTTWLYNEPGSLEVLFDGFSISSYSGDTIPCEENAIQQGIGGFFKFSSNQAGKAELLLDIDNNGFFYDAVDRRITKRIDGGMDSIYWNGKNGLGEDLEIGFGITIGYKLSLHAGEIHILMEDIENNIGGVEISLINDLSVANTNLFYYNHEPIGGTLSGDGSLPVPQPTSEPYTYSGNFGNEKILDYWTYVDLAGSIAGTITINVVEDCATPKVPDSDGDGISDLDDIDDDNDGIPDKKEYCNDMPGFSCLPGGLDPSGDADADGRPNYLDADDPAVGNNCADANLDGICDVINSIYDTDLDGVPDHLDLDSDNDGITDLVEAGHGQNDSNGDGMIDGGAALFGLNGLFNPIASHPDNLNAVETYFRFDFDSDGVPDHDDLDSDNDGIHDVTEAGYEASDSDNDGRIDDGSGNIPMVSKYGIAPLIDPMLTGLPIPLPPDWDGDGVPDWHDLDSDNDGINDVREANHPDPDNNGFIGEGTPVVNADGLATADQNGNPLNTTSNPVDTDADGTPDFHDLDSDDDTISDVHEAGFPDDDGDGIIGTGSPRVNAFGQPNADGNGNPLSTTSNPRDWDNDGMADFQDIDRDNDGIIDSYECANGWPCLDSDMDGLPDVDDLDSDNDGLPDAEECFGGIPCPDDNNNRVDNFREYDCNPNTIPRIEGISANSTHCEGDLVLLTATNAVAVTDSVTYTWRGPNGFFASSRAPAAGPFPLLLNQIKTDKNGLFTLTLVTDRGCVSDPEEVFLTVKPKPATPQISIDKEAYCAGETIQLSSSLYTGTNVSYRWYFNDGNTTNLLSVTSAATLFLPNSDTTSNGRYYVEVDLNGCMSGRSNLEDVTVFPNPVVPDPVNNSSFANPLCEGETIQLESGWIEDATYEWFGPAGFSALTHNPSITQIKETNEGIYFVVVEKNGCKTTSQPTEVWINPKPGRPTLAIPDAVCEGQEGMLEITAPDIQGANLSFDWYDADTDQRLATTADPVFIIPGVVKADERSYYVFIQLDGCFSEPSAPRNLRVDLIPEEEAFVEMNKIYTCGDEEIQLNAVQPLIAQGKWKSLGIAELVQPDAPNTFVYNLQSGSNWFVWSLSNGACINYDSDSLQVIHETMPLRAEDDAFVLKFNERLAGAEILLNDDFGDVQQWEMNIVEMPKQGTLEQEPDGTFSYNQRPNYFGQDFFVYELCNVNCPDQCDRAIVNIRTEGIDSQGECFIPNYITPNGDGSNDVFTIPCLDDRFVNNELMIFNRWGDKVFEAFPYQNDWDGTYRSNALPPGTYFYCLKLSPEQEAKTGYLTIIR